MMTNDQHSELAQQVITDYARSWSLLQAYDEQSFKNNEARQDDMHALALPDVLSAIAQLKQTFMGVIQNSYFALFHYGGAL